MRNIASSISKLATIKTNINMKALFNRTKFPDLAKSMSSSIDHQIRSLGETDFTNSTIDELTETLLKANKIDVPKLLEDEIYTKKPEDTKISLDGNRFGGRTIDGTKFTFVIPFNGDSNLFEYLPSTYLSIFPTAQIDKLELKVIFKVPIGKDITGLRTEFDRNLINIKKYLGFLDDDIKAFYSRLPTLIKGSLQKRKDKLDGDDAAANSFGFPIK